MEPAIAGALIGGGVALASQGIAHLFSAQRERFNRRSSRVILIVEEIGHDLFVVEEGLAPWEVQEPLSEQEALERRAFDDAIARIERNRRVLFIYWGDDSDLLANLSGLINEIGEASGAVRRSWNTALEAGQRPSKAERREMRRTYREKRRQWIDQALGRAESPSGVKASRLKRTRSWLTRRRIATKAKS